MTIMEYAQDINELYLESKKHLDMVECFIEAALQDYEINLKESAVKVIQESGNMDDYKFYVEAADEEKKGLITRAIEAIKNILRKLFGGFKKKVDSLDEEIRKGRYLEIIEEACKKDKKFANLGLDIESHFDAIKALQGAISEVRKNIFKVDRFIQMSKYSAASEEKVDDFIAKINKNLSGKLVTKKETIAVKDLRNRYNASYTTWKNDRSEKEVTEFEKYKISIEKSKAKGNNEKADQADRDMVKMANFLSKLKQDLARHEIMYHTSIAAAIKAAYTKAKVEADPTKMESAIAEMEELDSIFTLDIFKEDGEEEEEKEDEGEEKIGEMEGLDMDQYFDDLVDEVLNPASDEPSVDDAPSTDTGANDEKSEEEKEDKKEDKKEEEKAEEEAPVEESSKEKKTKVIEEKSEDKAEPSDIVGDKNDTKEQKEEDKKADEKKKEAVEDGSKELGQEEAPTTGDDEKKDDKKDGKKEDKEDKEEKKDTEKKEEDIKEYASDDQWLDTYFQNLHDEIFGESSNPDALTKEEIKDLDTAAGNGGDSKELIEAEKNLEKATAESAVAQTEEKAKEKKEHDPDCECDECKKKNEKKDEEKEEDVKESVSFEHPDLEAMLSHMEDFF